MQIVNLNPFAEQINLDDPNVLILNDEDIERLEKNKVAAALRKPPTKKARVISDRQMGKVRVLEIEQLSPYIPNLDTLLILFPEPFHFQIREAVRKDRNLINTLNACRLGAMDFFECMARLGINPYPDAPQTSCLYCAHLRTPQVPTGNFCMRSGKPERLEWLNGCEDRTETREETH